VIQAVEAREDELGAGVARTRSATVTWLVAATMLVLS
jgi:hypothetical protein